MKRNMGRTDRMIRLIIVAIISFLYFNHMISGTLADVLMAVAVVFFLTGLVSFCPIYLPFGINTCEKRQPTHNSNEPVC